MVTISPMSPQKGRVPKLTVDEPYSNDQYHGPVYFAHKYMYICIYVYAYVYIYLLHTCMYVDMSMHMYSHCRLRSEVVHDL